jgi:hypothetical protein
MELIYINISYLEIQMELLEIRQKINRLESFPKSKIIFNIIDELLGFTLLVDKDVVVYAEILDDLMSKLTENYDVVNKEQSELILSWVKQYWNETAPEYIDLLVTIAMNVELGKAKNYLKIKVNSVDTEHAKNLIRIAYGELES